nr:MAG TPA: hypothetical protein [Caudoviricetes sp.]
MYRYIVFFYAVPANRHISIPLIIVYHHSICSIFGANITTESSFL